MPANKAVATICLALALCAAPLRGLADCHVRGGQHVVLFGSSDDPDVFIWDSRFRLREYQGGSWDQAQALLPRALLATPGTRAIVMECVSNFVQPKYRDAPDDAVGVAIVSGPLRGQRGWVLGSDIRIGSRAARLLRRGEFGSEHSQSPVRQRHAF